MAAEEWQRADSEPPARSLVSNLAPILSNLVQLTVGNAASQAGPPAETVLRINAADCALLLSHAMAVVACTQTRKDQLAVVNSPQAPNDAATVSLVAIVGQSDSPAPVSRPRLVAIVGQSDSPPSSPCATPPLAVGADCHDDGAGGADLLAVELFQRRSVLSRLVYVLERWRVVRSPVHVTGLQSVRNDLLDSSMGDAEELCKKWRLVAPYLLEQNPAISGYSAVSDRL